MKKILGLFLLALTPLSYVLGADAPDIAKVNTAFGIKLFTDDKLSDDSPKDLGERLGFRFMGARAGNKMVAYCDKIDKEILGAKPEQFKFSFDKSGIDDIDIVFFNKGDSMDKDDVGKSSVGAKMRKDAKTILTSLESVFGEPENGYFGSGKMRSSVKEWKYAGQSIMFDFKDKEYVIVRLRPLSENGESSDSKKEIVDRKKDFSANVKTESNGDVHITGIPMVDQGDKGYCTTAVLEMCLRYYGIENIDMHKIAQICETGAGGGTYITSVMDSFKKATGAYRLKIIDAKLNMQQIKKFINDGVPICWSIHCTKEHVERMGKNTATRAAAADFEKWSKEVKRQKKIAASKSRNDGHTCLIIGYNPNTNELGICNSWGEKASLLWMRFEDAKMINLSSFAISPK